MNSSQTLLGACRAWDVESENRPQRGQFLPDLQSHSPTMGQEYGEKWTAAADLQPTLRKSGRLLEVGPIPQILHLYPGETVTCARGGVWMTSEALAGQGTDSDVVLVCGQAFVAQQTADYFVSGLRRYGPSSFIDCPSQPQEKPACYWKPNGAASIWC